MRITPASTYDLYQVTAAAAENRTEKQSKPLSGIRQGDTVSFSSEALSLAEMMIARKAAEAGNAEEEERNGADGAAGGGSSAQAGGKLSSEKELAAEIYKVKKEVKDLSEQVEEIMASEGGMEEKVRLSQPVQKRLTERLQDLQNLQAQARNLREMAKSQG